MKKPSSIKTAEEPLIIQPDNPHFTFYANADRYKETIQFLILCGHGEMLDNLAETVKEMSRATEHSAKKSSFTLKVELSPDVGSRRTLTYDIKSKIPKEDTSETTVWVTDQHQFVEGDPSQLQLNLKVVGSIERQLKEAAPKPPLRAAGEN